MTLEELAALVASARFLPPGAPPEEAAVRVLPALLEGLPPTRVDTRGPRIPSGCTEALGLDRLPGILAAAAAAPDAEGAVANDPLVVDLAALVAEGVRHSEGAAVVPLLEVIRAAALAQSEPSLAALHEGDPAVSGPALRRVAVAVQGRLAAACARVAERERVPALAWALTRSRLGPLYPRGTLERELPWSRVAEILDVPLPAGTVEAVEAALRLTVKGVMERRAAGKGTPDDAALLLRHLSPSRLGVGIEAAAAQLLLDPEALAAILPGLARYTDAKTLAAVGVDATRAARLLAPAGGVATASAMAEVIEALREWDVVSQIAAAVAPATVKALAVPRGTVSKAAIVLVGLSRLRADAGGATVVENGWRELRQRAEGGITADYGYAGLAAFPDPVDALRFALAAARRLDGAPVSLAWGLVQGGTDGRRTTISGPAVEGAIRWLSVGPLPRGALDEGPTRLRVNGGWLCGNGLAIEASAAEALQEARIRRGLLTGADGPPGGDSRVTRSLDLFAASEFDGSVLALVRIPGVAGGFEMIYLPLPDWRRLLDKDEERAAAASLPAPPVAVETDLGVTPAVAVAEEAPQEEPGAWEMAELDELPDEAPVTLDLAEGTADLPPVPPEQPGFDFHEDSAEVPAEEPPGFSGFYLPDVETQAASLARPSRPTTLPPAEPPAFEMEVEEEETEEWQPVVARAPTMPPVRPNPTLSIPPGESARLLPPEPDMPPIFHVDVEEDTFEVPEELREQGPGDEHSSTFVSEASASPNDGSSGDPFASLAGPVEEVSPAPGGLTGADPFADPVSDAPPAGDPFAGPAEPAPAGDPFDLGGDLFPPGARLATAEPAGVSTDPFAESAEPAPVESPAESSEPPAAESSQDLANQLLGLYGDPFLSSVPTEPPAPAVSAEEKPKEEPPPRVKVLTLPPSVTARVASIATSNEDSRPPRRPEPTGDPRSAPSAPSRGRSRAQAAQMDFDFLLKGYAVFFEKKEVVFGRPYGTRLVDRHVYPYSGDVDGAYRAFLEDKIREGFVPRADLIGDLPRGVTVMPLDMGKLQAAWKELS